MAVSYITQTVGGPVIVLCLSTDTKPAGASTLWIAWETDTGNRFRWDGNAWVQTTGFTAGAGLSYTNGVLSATGGSTPTGIFLDSQFSVLQGDGNLAEAAGVQTWAGSDRTSQDVFTLLANSTYRFRGQYYINTGTTTHTTALAWALGGATVVSFEYLARTWSAAANTIVTTESVCHVSGVASKVINATSTAAWTLVEFEGTCVTGTGGTITPQIAFSANPTGICLMKRGSWVEFQRLGADTVTLAGGWA